MNFLVQILMLITGLRIVLRCIYIHVDFLSSSETQLELYCVLKSPRDRYVLQDISLEHAISTVAAGSQPTKAGTSVRIKGWAYQQFSRSCSMLLRAGARFRRSVKRHSFEL